MIDLEDLQILPEQGSQSSLDDTGEVLSARIRDLAAFDWNLAATQDITATPVTTRSPDYPIVEEKVTYDPFRYSQFIRTPVTKKYSDTRIKTAFECRFEMHIETSPTNSTLLFTATINRYIKSSMYEILHHKSDGNPQCIGKVQSDFSGSRLSGLYDMHGKEQCVILFVRKIFEKKEPRVISVYIHSLNSPSSTSITEQLNAISSKDIVQLKNKIPQWNEESSNYVLDFQGRVSVASVKNFQLVHDQDLDYIVLQFGKVETDEFSLDFSYPMSPFQAFCIGLSTLDRKLFHK